MVPVIFLSASAWYFRVPAGRVEIRLLTANPTALEALVSLQTGTFGGVGGRQFTPTSSLAPLALPGVTTFVNPSDPWQPEVPVDWTSPDPFAANQVWSFPGADVHQVTWCCTQKLCINSGEAR
jgi:hypothetical protein